uniref:SMP-30/Gluconolactonase/LRE-like region domain-containing protein n=1 Tax=Coccolithus braarudii TaxID=221442 RepID=A0A7S0LSL4_9EUKA|eukprot:CAMPEP_0183341166 /NCGR_PEP_ID=MMETSP0164_2-20130417/7451_1 /TAXON_ID=221442 /ORGANISM="Coccolithus pelagicus ssp braarudi, Strain PLY182g" /LENGTH=314 /DNA_ID=CAMNT_0025511401 /DNA_START=78 /DNA_END=1022 /DNA_ORIENTATION=-
MRSVARCVEDDWRVLSWEKSISGRQPALCAAGFYFHRHVTGLPGGQLAFPDVHNRAIRVLDQDGTFVRVLHSGQMMGPRGPACDGQVLYVVESAGQSLHAIRLKDGSVNTWCVPSSEDDAALTELVTPDTCAVDGSLLFVSNAGRDSVLVYEKTSFELVATLGKAGGGPGTAHGEFNRPQGLTATRSKLWVCDSGNCRIQVFNGPTFDFERCFGKHGNQPGCFNEPRGVAVCDSVNGDLLVVSETRRLQVLTLDGSPLQVLPQGPSPSLRTQASFPPGLWGICATRDRVYTVNVISNELLVLSLRRSNTDFAAG